MFTKIYELFIKCLPKYMTEKIKFYEIIKPEFAHIIYEYDNDELVGFCIIHGNVITLLCVDPNYRRKGIGSKLLEQAEKYIKVSGAEKIIIGRGIHYILQGVPAENEEAVRFFENRGYHFDWTTVNMCLDLENFDPNDPDIPKKPDMISFRFADENDRASLLVAVEDAKSNWLEIFVNNDCPVLLALDNGKIVGFEIVKTGSTNFVYERNAGSIGCVGVIHEYRNKGIGRQMVIAGTKFMRTEGCSLVELLYVEFADWYKKLGFEPISRQMMGEKLL